MAPEGEERSRREREDRAEDGSKDDESNHKRRSRSRDRSARRRRSRSRSRKRSRPKDKDKEKDRDSKHSREDPSQASQSQSQSQSQLQAPSTIAPSHASHSAPTSAPHTQPQPQPQHTLWAQQLLLQQQQQQSQQAVGGSHERKRREIYVGNLAIGVVTSQVLTEVFNEALQYLLPEQAASAYGTPWATPVVSCQMDSSGKFAFIEFRTEDLATAALKLDRLEICGRPINAGRPKGYVSSSPGQPHLSNLPNLAPQQQPPGFSGGAARPGMPNAMPAQQQQQQQQHVAAEQTPSPHLAAQQRLPAAPVLHQQQQAQQQQQQQQKTPQQLEAAKQFAEQISLQTGDTESSAKPAKQIPDEYFSAPASRCLLVEGMVPIALLAARGEREEVEHDARQQCSQLVEVEDVYAPSPGPEEIRRRELSRVYVLCRDADGGREARLRLHNRQYDTNRMVVRCVHESEMERAKHEGWVSVHSVLSDEGWIKLTNLPSDVHPREVSEFLSSYGVTEEMVSVEPSQPHAPGGRAQAAVNMKGEHAQARMVRIPLHDTRSLAMRCAEFSDVCVCSYCRSKHRHWGRAATRYETAS